ncbi:hypothetical protein [Xenorhabdus siamensis]|uniref:hypothetical protein n=1 Tax=Xenorhabdus siamensis TaxID=3136254 RepID=UPI003BF4B56E
MFAGSINADVFHAWMTQDLLPKLPGSAVIVMDNASFHKRNNGMDAPFKRHQCAKMEVYSTQPVNNGSRPP